MRVGQAQGEIFRRRCDKINARPCEVDGKLAFFHRWVDDESVLLKIGAFVNPEQRRALEHVFHEDRVIPPGCSVTVIHYTFALVEDLNGTVAKVKPELVKFLDREVMKE